MEEPAGRTRLPPGEVVVDAPCEPVVAPLHIHLTETGLPKRLLKVLRIGEAFLPRRSSSVRVLEEFLPHERLSHLSPGASELVLGTTPRGYSHLPSGTDHSHHVEERGLVPREQEDDEAGHDGVECGIGERKIESLARHQRVNSPISSPAEHLHGGVEAHDEPLRPHGLGGLDGGRARAGADVEDPPTLRWCHQGNEIGGRKRMELGAHAIVRLRDVIVGTPVPPPGRLRYVDFLAPSASTHVGHCIVLAVNKPRHGGHLLAGALTAEGVGHLFTLSGGHIAPLYDGCVAEGIRIVDFRHEQTAVHAADGWARLTGFPGVAAVTAGPGVTGSVTAIANAFYANSPMLVVGGKSPLAELGMGSFQEMDQATLVGSVSKWARTCWETGRISDFVAEAFRHATAGRQGPVFVDVPVDVLAARWPPGVEVADRSRTDARPLGDPENVSRAIHVIGEAEHLVILAGSGLRWSGAHEALAALADALKVPVFLNSLGRGCLPPSHPAFFSAARAYALGKADVILALGVEWDFRLGFGRRSFPEGVRVVQVDIDATQIGRNRSVDVGIVGDPGEVIRQFLDRGVGNASELPWTGDVRDEEERLTAEAHAGMTSDAEPIHPLRLVREVRDFLDPEAIVVGDGGDIVGIGASVIQPHQPGHWLDPGPFGCLGVGPPFAIAAKLAKPDEQVLVLYGDGSFGLSAMEYESAIRQRIPFVGVIGNDGAWGQIKVAQESLYGEGNAPAAVLSQETGYDRMVQALGGYGERVTAPGEIRSALRRAFDSGVPACVNVIVDPALMKRTSYLG